MERRLQKDFQIGIVEGIVQAVIQNEKEPKDVFSQIAKAIGRKGSAAGKKDWNAVVRQSTIPEDPIGSTNEAVERQTRRSLRRHLRHQPNSDLASMDPKRLLDYNPNLSDLTPVTRIAYAKFMLSRNKPDERSNDTNNSTKKETEKAPRRNSKVIIAETCTNTVPRPANESLKKSLLKSTSSSSVDKSAVLDVKTIQVRAPSPIPEDLVGEEINKQSTSLATSDQEKRVEEKENEQKQQSRKDEEASGEEVVEERKEKELMEDESKRQQLGNTEGSNNNNTGQVISETDRELKAETCAGSDAKEEKPEMLPVSTTKLRGKSKATGRVMGGWI